jgi:hypothetical protein
MSILKNAKKLGFGGTLDILENVNLEPSNNPALKSFKIKTRNFGTLKNPNLAIVAEKQIEYFNDNNSAGYYGRIFSSDKKIPSDTYYLAISEFHKNTYGELFDLDLNSINIDYFDKKFVNKTLKYSSGDSNNTDRTKFYTRFAFPRSWNVHNTTILSGVNATYTTPDILNSNTQNTLKNDNCFIYYAPKTGYVVYPQTVFQQTFPKYNVDTKLTRNSLHINYGMNGLLVLSTGDIYNKNIVYVSPHDINTTYLNTLVHNASLTLAKVQPEIETSRTLGLLFPQLGYGGGVWLAGSLGGRGGTQDLFKSSDNGISWQSLTNVFSNSISIGSIEYATGRWNIGTSISGRAIGYTSTNSGNSWSLFEFTGSNNSINSPVKYLSTPILHNGNQWCTIGYTGGSTINNSFGYRSLSSKDGINWSGSTIFPSGKYNVLAYGDGKWITLNNVSNVTDTAHSGLYSTDGINWNNFRITGKKLGYTLSPGFPNINWNGVTSGQDYKSLKYANGQFIAIPVYGNEFRISTNGTGWSVVTLTGVNPYYSRWADLTHDGTKWIASLTTYYPNDFAPGTTYGVPYVSMVESVDGISWTRKNLKNAVGKQYSSILSNESGHTVLGASLYLRRLENQTYTPTSVASGMVVQGIIIDSMFSTGNIFPESGLTSKTYAERSGIRNNSSQWPTSTTPGFENRFDNEWIMNNIPDLYNEFPSLTSSEIQTLLIQESYGQLLSMQDLYKVEDHIQQSTPLKDTWFYKLYSGVYSVGNKNINTGTWNGIIPSGTQLFAEYLSTTDFCGTLNKFLLVHTGYGFNSIEDVNIRAGMLNNFRDISPKYFQSISFKSMNDAFWINNLKYQKYKRNAYVNAALSTQENLYSPSKKYLKRSAFLLKKQVKNNLNLIPEWTTGRVYQNNDIVWAEGAAYQYSGVYTGNGGYTTTTSYPFSYNINTLYNPYNGIYYFDVNRGFNSNGKPIFTGCQLSNGVCTETVNTLSYEIFGLNTVYDPSYSYNDPYRGKLVWTITGSNYLRTEQEYLPKNNEVMGQTSPAIIPYNGWRYLSFVGDFKINPNTYDYYSIFDIPSGITGCFKLSDNSLYCL